MCTTCGCGNGETRIDGVDRCREPRTADAHEHGTTDAHGDTHWHVRHGGAQPRARAGRTRTSMPTARGTATSTAAAARTATRPRPALGAAHDARHVRRAHRPDRAGHPRQERRATPRANRQLLADRGIFALNLVSSPGSGKTTLLVRTIEALQGRVAGRA